MSDREIRRHYSSRSAAAESRKQRKAGPLIQLKELNNAVKATLIASYSRHGDRVLDLACGKGGDLLKWNKARISSYTGVDYSPGCIEQARSRYQAGRFSFPAQFLRADCFRSPLDVGAVPASFDIASCQFALHYSWTSEHMARLALHNVSALLKPGGFFIGTIPDANIILQELRRADALHFGNSCYRIEFPSKPPELSSHPFGVEYRFHLLDGAVNCPEWLVHFSTFQALAKDCGLELLYAANFHDFVKQHAHNPCFAQLTNRSHALELISDHEWDTARLYMGFVFRKVGRPHRENRCRKHYAQDNHNFGVSGHGEHTRTI